MSRPLTAADLGLTEDSVDRLAGRVSIIGTQMIVRVENIRIAVGMRGQQSVAGMINSLRAIARQGGLNCLVIEGLSIGNPQLARILTRRYGGAYTPQRMIVINLALD